MIFSEMCWRCYLAETKAVNPKGYGGWPPLTLPFENNSKEIKLPRMAFLTLIGDSLPTVIICDYLGIFIPFRWK